MRRPFLTVGLTILCTMFLLFWLGTLYTLILAAVLLAVCSVIVFLRHREASSLVLIGMASILAVSSFSYTQNNLIGTAMLYCGENISVSGTLADYPTLTNDRYVYRLENCTLCGEETSFSLHLSDNIYYEAKPGDVLHFTALKIYPSAEKDSQYYYSAMSDGVFLRAYTDSVQIEAGTQSRLRYLPAEVRHYMLDIIQDRLESTHAAVLSGLMLGNTDTLDTKTALQFSASGISHLFAVSGFHVSFWTGVFLRLFGRRKKHIIPSLLACAFLFFFMALTGFSVSVCRSGLMAFVIFFGNLFRREADSLNSLGLALTVLLLHSPFAAADASLLLSAAATAAIILSSRPIQEYVTVPMAQKIKHKLVRRFVLYASDLLCLSAAVTLALMPLTSILFGSFSMMTPLANILCIPPAQGAMTVGIAALLSNPIPYFSDFLFRLTELLLDLLLIFTKALASVPAAMVMLNTAATFIWAAASILLIAFVHKKYDRLPRRAFFTAVCSALSLLIMFNAFCFAHKDEVMLTVHDTGNATCITLFDNNGNAAVIGCGGDDYTVETLSRQMRSYGIEQPRLLLIPDKRETENANAWALNRALSPQHVVTTEWTTAPDSNITVTNASTVTLWKDAVLHFESTEQFRAAHIGINGFDIVICFYPSSDFASADSIYQSGDLLICRQSIPATVDTARFEQIILSSDKEEQLYNFSPALTEQVITTADEGSIELIIG